MSGLSKLKGLWKRRIAVLIAAVLIFEGTILPVSAATLSSATSSEQEQRIESIEGDSSILDDEQSMNSLSGNVISGNSDKEVSDNAGESALSMNDNKASTLELDGVLPDPDFTLTIAKGSEHANLYVDEYGNYRVQIVSGKSIVLSVNSVDQTILDYSDLSVSNYDEECLAISTNTTTGSILIESKKITEDSFSINLGSKSKYIGIASYPVTDQFYFINKELVYFIDEMGMLDPDSSNNMALDFGFGEEWDDGYEFREQILDVSSNNANVKVYEVGGLYGYSIHPLSEGESTVSAIYQNPITKEQIKASVLVKVYRKVSCSYNNLEITHFVTNNEFLGNLAIPVSSNDYKWKYTFMSMKKFSNASTSSLPIVSEPTNPYRVNQDGYVETTIFKIAKPILSTMPSSSLASRKKIMLPTIDTRDLVLSGNYINDMRINVRPHLNYINNNSNYIFDYEYKELSKLGLVFDTIAYEHNMISPMTKVIVTDAQKGGKAKVEVTQKVYRKKVFDFDNVDYDLTRSEVDFDEYELVSTTSSEVGFNVVNEYKGLAITEYTHTDELGNKITTFDTRFFRRLQPGDTFTISCNSVGFTNDAVSIKSRNSKILKVTQTDKNHATVLVQQCGNTKLVVSAKSNPKIAREVSVQICDYAPIIMDKKTEINALKGDGVRIAIEEAYETSFSNVVVQSIKSKKETLSSNSLVIGKLNGNQYQLAFASKDIAKNFKNGTYLVTLAADYGDNKGQIIGTILVTVVRKEPKISIKQIQDVNGFYSTFVSDKLLCDNELFAGKMRIVSQSGDVSDYAVKDQDSEDYTIMYDSFYESDKDSMNDVYSILARYGNKKFTSMDRKITLLLQVEDYYEPVEKAISIRTRNTPYKFELHSKVGQKSTILFKNIDSCVVNGAIYNATLKKYYKGILENDIKYVNLSSTDDFLVDGSKNDDFDEIVVRIKNLKEVSKTCKFTMQSPKWSKPVAISYAFKINQNQPKVKYLTSKIILNDYYVYQNDGKNAENLSDISKIYLTTDYFEQMGAGVNLEYELKDSKGNNLYDTYKIYTSSTNYKGKPAYEITMYAKKEVKPGTYKIYLTPTFTHFGNNTSVVKGKTKEITVKVMNKKPQLSMKLKGKLDIAKSYNYKQLEIVTDFLDYDAEMIKMDSVVYGEDGYLFKVVEDNGSKSVTGDYKYYLALKDPTYKLDTKKTYSVDLNVKYKVDYSKPFQSEKVTLKFKPIEKKSKLEPIKKTVTISARQGNYATVPIGLKWNEYIEKAIKYGGRVELLNYSKEFSVDSDLGYGYQNDSFNKSMKLFLNTNEVSDLVIGKTYPVKLKITPNAYALEGSSYTVTVYVKVVE